VRKIFLLLCLLSGASAYADTASDQVDANVRRLELYMTNSDTNGLYKVLVNINDNFHLYYGKEFLPLFHRAAVKAEKDSMVYVACFYSFKGLWYKNNGSQELAIDNFVKSYLLDRVFKGPAQGMWTLVEIGNIFYAENDPDQAAIFYNKALEPAVAVNDHFALSVIYLNLGLVERSRGNIPEQIDWLKKSAQERLLSKDPVFVCHTYSKLSDAYLEMHKADSALKYLEEAKRIYANDGDKFGLLYEMPALIDLGYYRLNILLGRDREAAQFLSNARKYLQEKKLVQLFLQTLLVESKYLAATGNDRALVNLLDTAIDDFHREGQTDLERQALHYLAKSYAALGDEKLSMAHYEKLIAIEDSLKKSNYQTKLNQIRSIIELFEKDASLQIAKQELLHQQEQDRLRTIQRNIILGFTIAAFILSIFLFILLGRNKRQKQDLSHLNRELELRHEEIQRTAVELEKSHVIKDKLFSIIGHDLRSPLNVLLGQTGLIKKEIEKTSVSGSITSQVQFMETTLKETVDLFERLLQWSKLDKKEIHFNPSPVQVGEMAKQVVRFYEPLLHQKKIRVETDTNGETGFGDPNITQTILRNLVSNSINALQEGGLIKIRTRAETELLFVTISDNGKGFPESLLKSFPNTYKVDPRKPNGLGLVLCRELATMNHGELTLENPETGGASATFTLPLFKEKIFVNSEPEMKFSIGADWRKKLSGLSAFKVYQSTQVRSFLRGLGTVEDGQITRWMAAVEKAVFLGNRELFEKLLREIENEKTE
jgi:signal transduction histidine kinase